MVRCPTSTMWWLMPIIRWYRRINEEKEKKCRKELDKFDEKLKPLQDNKAELEKANKGQERGRNCPGRQGQDC